MSKTVHRGARERGAAMIHLDAPLLAKIRLGLLELKRGKHYNWIKFQNGLRPPIDVLALVRQYYGLSDDQELNPVQRRTAELLAGGRVTAKKDWKERKAVEAKEWIDANLLPKLGRGRPSGAGKGHPVELHPPGATEAVKFIDVHPTIAEVVEIAIPAIQEHVSLRIDLTTGRGRRALTNAIFSLIAKPDHPIRAKTQKATISRKIAEYFSKI
jgi:hypothetical protein